MYKPSSYLPSSCLFSYLFNNIWSLFCTKLVTKVQPNINSIQVHPQSNSNKYPVGDALVGAGSLWLIGGTYHGSIK